MATGLMEEEGFEKQIKKQMGCMAGFLQIFDRRHILTGKRPQRSRRLSSSPPAYGTTSDPKETAPPPATELLRKSSPTRLTSELRYGARPSWKFCKETQRLSLDSRATTDGESGLHRRRVRCGDAEYDQQHRSSSVIARLMGLEPLSNSCDDFQPENQPKLRRSASESRVSDGLFQSRLMTDCNYTRNPRPPPTQRSCHSENVTINHPNYPAPLNQSFEKSVKCEIPDRLSSGDLNSNSRSSWRAPSPRKSFLDSGDVFPEPKQCASIYSEIEKRFKIRGIDEPSNDLETLKLILEALHLNGILHYETPPPPNQVHHRDFVNEEAPIALPKPSRSSPTKPINRQSSASKQVGEVRRSHSLTSETPPSQSPRRERKVTAPTRCSRTPSPTSRNIEVNANASRSNSPAKQKQPLIQRRANEAADRRPSPVRSPKINGFESNRSPRRQKEKITTVASTEDPYSPVSQSCAATSTDTKRWKAEDRKEGESLLERCDKLLHELAATKTQPSPVSVLDSSLYKDASPSTRSPLTIKRNLDFKESEEEISTPVVSPIKSKCLDPSLDSDYKYISDILGASNCLPKHPNAFQLLEKQQHLKGHDTSKASTLKRRLIFDTISEILDRENRLPPQKAVASGNTALGKVWSEFRRIRTCEIADDMYETICRVLKKDLAGDAISGWGNHPEETSEVVLDIERMVFKDMVSEIIQDLSTSAYIMLRRRKFSSFL